MKTLFLFILVPLLLTAQTFVGLNVGNTDFKSDISFSGSMTYQPTMFGAKVQYYDSMEANSWQLQTTVEPFRGEVWTPVASVGYSFNDNGTQPMVGFQNQMQVEPNVYVTAGYEATFERSNPATQYIYFGVVMQVIEPETKPRRFF